jgi:hypothetical protein
MLNRKPETGALGNERGGINAQIVPFKELDPQGLGVNELHGS